MLNTSSLLHSLFIQVASRPYGFFLKPVPNFFPSFDGGASLLSFTKKDVIWVCFLSSWHMINCLAVKFLYFKFDSALKALIEVTNVR